MVAAISFVCGFPHSLVRLCTSDSKFFELLLVSTQPQHRVSSSAPLLYYSIHTGRLCRRCFPPCSLSVKRMLRHNHGYDTFFFSAATPFSKPHRFFFAVVFFYHLQPFRTVWELICVLWSVKVLFIPCRFHGSSQPCFRKDLSSGDFSALSHTFPPSRRSSARTVEEHPFDSHSPPSPNSAFF